MALLVSATPAQIAATLPKLVPLGKACSCSDGTVVRCLVRDDSAHMLTLGQAGDLVWWDLRARRAIRWLPPTEALVVDMHLHPSEPVAICDLTNGAVRRLDLTTGGAVLLAAAEANARRPATAGWLSGGLPDEGDVVSHDGSQRIAAGTQYRRRQPHQPGQTFDTAAALWLANDGTAIEQTGERLRLQGRELGDRTVANEHMAPAQQLCFTRNGSHLAILGFDGAQIVDIAGTRIARFQGTHLARPGPAGDEFWLLTADSMQRWSATRRAFVGDPVRWPGRQLEVKHVALGEWRLRPVLVRGGQPWTDAAHRLPDGAFRSLDRSAEPTVAFDDNDGNATPMLLTSMPGYLSPASSTIRRFADDGTTMHYGTVPDSALWLARSPDGTRAWIGCSKGTVQQLRTTSLETLATAVFDPPLLLTVAIDEERLLAWNGEQLLCIATATLASIGTVALPPGEGPCSCLIVSSDRRQLALARGSEVHLLQVQ